MIVGLYWLRSYTKLGGVNKGSVVRSGFEFGLGWVCFCISIWVWVMFFAGSRRGALITGVFFFIFFIGNQSEIIAQVCLKLVSYIVYELLLRLYYKYIV